MNNGSLYKPPPKVWQIFKYRLYRLFGTKPPPGFRKEFLERIKYKFGIIRSSRFTREINKILKENYEDSFEEIMFPSSKLLKAIK